MYVEVGWRAFLYNNRQIQGKEKVLSRDKYLAKDKNLPYSRRVRLRSCISAQNVLIGSTMHASLKHLWMV